MEDTIKEDIISVLKEAVTLLKNEKYRGLKELSNHTIHNASIFQDQDSVSVAVIIYSISKIMERAEKKRKQTAQKMAKVMNNAITLLKKDKIKGFRTSIKKLLEIISKTDERLQKFIEEVIRQAQIKKGTKLHEHGISIAKAADILGISQWELMNYVGKTTLAEEVPVDVKKRLAFAEKLFGK